MVNSSFQHMTQFVFILRRHDHHIGQRAQVGNIEHSLVGRTIFAYDSSAIHGKGDVQVHQADIVSYLIVSPLQKRGVDGKHWTEPSYRKGASIAHRMLFRHAHIESTFGKYLPELADSRTIGHCSGNTKDLFIRFGQFNQGVSKHGRVSRIGFLAARDKLSSGDIERTSSVPDVGLLFR